MITYELAKRLKDSGFPQKNWPHPKLYDHSQEKWIDGKAQGIIDEEGSYVPTLEELIEACGNEFIALVKQLDADRLPWRCDTNKTRTYGHSPSEAVANLYLALNTNGKEKH